MPTRQKDNRRRSDFYQAEDLMYSTPNKNGNNEGQEPAAWVSKTFVAPALYKAAGARMP